jgi:SAM-dependent methyltransferase
MSFTGWLQRRWNGVCDRTIGTEEFWHLAVDHQSAYDALKPMIQDHVRGLALDIGAGRLAWRDLIAASAERYVATDAFETHPDIAFVSDVQGNLPVADRTFDSAFCCSVLEHTQEPWKAFDEFYRVLKPGGKMVLSVPFLYYLHGQPSDYYRFTRYGVENLARKSGFEIVELADAGGLGHSVLQALSMLTTSVLFHPSFPYAARGVCWLLTRMARLIDAVDRGRLFAQSINAVLRRPL